MKKNKKRSSEQPSRKTESLFLRNLKGISVYLCCIGIALFIMYYFEGDAGMLLAIALGCALLLSLLVTLLVKSFLQVSCTVDTTSVNKGDVIRYVIRVNKTITFPTPVIELYMDCSPHLTKEIDVYKLTLGFHTGNQVEIPVLSRHTGVAHIGMRDVLISDYLGVFCFRLKTSAENNTVRLSVYPNIPDVAVQTNFLKTAVLFSGGDDEEEETDETALVQTGFPGYDHREYYPGDPVKRINWKLSSKRDIYMIRLDEKMAGTGQLFFLDMPPAQQNEITLSVRDNIIEGMLAVFTMIVQEGNEVILFFPNGTTWQRKEIRHTADIQALQELTADFAPCLNGQLIPKEIITSHKTPICFTTATAENLSSVSQIVSQIPDGLLISSELARLPQLTSEMWLLSDDWELKKY